MLTSRRPRVFRLRHLALAAWVVSIGTLLAFGASAFVGRPHHDAFGNPLLPDFIAHYVGGGLAGSDALYSIPSQVERQQELLLDRGYMNLFISPPYVAWIYAPFAKLPLSVAMISWLVLVGACFIASERLLSRVADPPKRYQKRLFVLFALSFQPVLEVFIAGQDTCLTALVWALGIHFALRRKDFASGIAFGFGVVKPQLFLLPALYLVMQRRYRALGGLLASGSACLVVGLAFGGPAAFRGWLAILQSPAYLDATRATRIRKMHSLFAMLEGLAPPTLQGAARVVAAIIAVGVAVATLRVAMRLVDERRAWALLVVATLLVCPHLFTYDLALLVIPAALLLRERWRRSTVYAILVLYALLWLSAIRATAFRDADWPLTILAISFSPIAMLVIWRDLGRSNAVAVT